MKEIFIFFLHGLSYSGLLFLIASGLTLVFGMMRVLNFAHASFYMLGAYFSYTIAVWSDHFWVSLIFGPLILFMIGAIIERVFLRRVHTFGLVYDLLLTFGLGYVIGEVVKWIWGTKPLSVSVSGILNDTVIFFGISYPIYRLFILFVAMLIGILLAIILFRTKLGIIIRAAVDDNQMVNALGVNIPLIFMSVFAFGAALAGFAGVIAGPLLSTSTDMANLVLIDAFVVVIVGGLGSLRGSVVSSLIVGQLNSFGVLLIPRISMALIYLMMAIILVYKPLGLFGVKK